MKKIRSLRMSVKTIHSLRGLERNFRRYINSSKRTQYSYLQSHFTIASLSPTKPEQQWPPFCLTLTSPPLFDPPMHPLSPPVSLSPVTIPGDPCVFRPVSRRFGTEFRVRPPLLLHRLQFPHTNKVSFVS